MLSGQQQEAGRQAWLRPSLPPSPSEHLALSALACTPPTPTRSPTAPCPQERLARFMGTEEAILYSYDLATLPSILPAFANKKDLIICDEVGKRGG